MTRIKSDLQSQQRNLGALTLEGRQESERNSSGVEQAALVEKVKDSLDLKDFVRVEEVQDAFAKLTESFQKKIKEQATAQESAIVALKEQLDVVRGRALEKDPLSSAIGDPALRNSDLPLSGRTSDRLARMKEDLDRQRLQNAQFGQIGDGDQGLSHRSDRDL